MALERPPGAIRFMFRLKMQHHPCDFTPVSTFHIRIEQAQIRDEMFFVVSRQHRTGGRPHQRRNAFILIHVAERIFAAGASSTTYLSQPSVATR